MYKKNFPSLIIKSLETKQNEIKTLPFLDNQDFKTMLKDICERARDVPEELDN